MTDEHFDAQDERSQLDTVESFDMANLRKVAKILGLAAQRDWTKEDFVRAIKTKQEKSNVVSIVLDDSRAPAPGHARIIIHRDMTPGHKNSPIHLGVNGRLFQVPRGIQVDLPEPYLEVLNNAQTIVASMDENGQVREQAIQSYPYQLVAATPGKFHNPHDGRAANAKQRKDFMLRFGHYPTDGELKEAMKAEIAQSFK